MSKTLTEWLVKPLLEGIDLDVEVGDTILMGRFKNKRVKVKSIDYNDKGDLLINGRPALKFRIQKQGKKLLPQKTTDKDSTSPDGDMKGVKKFENDDSDQLEEKAKRDYKDEYKKFQSSKKAKKYRAELNKYNRQKGTYGNGDKKDASHKNGKIAGYEDQSKNRGRREKSRLKKEINENKITLNVPSDIKKIYKLFKKNGKQLYVVGGAVRDAILGKRPKDFDLATDAKPDEVLKIAKKGGMKTYEVGKQFGVVVVGGHEIATFRKDIGKGRRPDAVDFSDIQGDVKRRDLTINAMFYDIERSEVVDLTGGLTDLKNKIIRTVGKAKERFDEDPLRKLRALRFQAVVGGKMDKDTAKALMINPSLKGVSFERVREEFIKAIEKGKSSQKFMDELDKFGFTKQMFPQVNISKPYPNVKNYILFLATILRKNNVGKLPKILNKLKYSGEEVNNITFLVYLNDFKPQNIYMVKKAQEKTTLSSKDIINYGRIVGKDFSKIANFKLSVKASGDEFVGLKGREIGDKIKELETKNFLGEEKNFTFGTSWIPTSLSQRKKMKKLHKRTNRSIRGENIPSPSRAGINKNKTDKMSGYKKIKELKKTLDNHMESVVYLGMENGDSATISEQKIKKVVGVYGGRFQPFGPHHLKTYKWLKTQVDDAYITTSDLKKPPRHPMNFKEKVRHMTKMGVPANRIVKETTPYVAKNLLKKFGKDTAVVYIFGKKDAGRLSGGKKKDGSPGYFQDYKKNKSNINILGSPKIKDEDRPKIFKKLFGYYDKGVFTMMNNKFKKLFEFYNQQSIKDLIKEVSALGDTVTASDLDDEGLYDFFGSFKDYKRVSPKHAEIMGWEVVADIIGKNAKDPGYDFSFAGIERVPTVTFGKTINQDTSNEDSVDNPFPKYRAHMTQMANKMGMEILKFFGKPTAKMKDSHTHDMKTSTSGVKKIKKMQESYLEDVRVLLEGGAYGHMSHPFDDNNLTFSDLKTIIINGLGGQLSREDGVTEKLDGQNLMVSWIDGKLKAARNKGHIKNFGKTAPTTSGIKSMFSGRGNIEKAFVGAMKDLEKSIGSLSDKQKEKVFGNGKRWMNLEVMYPATANVVDYDVAEIIFHGTLEYDESGRPVGQPKDSARMLAGMIKQTNNHIQKMFKIGKPNFLTVPKVQDFGKKKSMYLGKLKKLQSQYSLNDKDTLGEYHESYWREYIFNASKQFKVKLKPAQFAKLVQRWAYFDKSYKIPEIKKDYQDNPKFLDWILSTDKQDHSKIFKNNIKPFEILFFSVGAEILKNISGYMAVNPNKTIQKMRKEMISAMKDLQKPDKIEKLKKLKIQIEKLQKIGGLKAIVPSEGIVFKYKGNTYKFTGAFAPINQILGSIKFG